MSGSRFSEGSNRDCIYTIQPCCVGKEGKKKNWQPYDCMRIIMESVGAGENHGCPFRHHEGKVKKTLFYCKLLLLCFFDLVYGP